MIISKDHGKLTPIGREMPKKVRAWHVLGAVQVIMEGRGGGRNSVKNASASERVDPGGTQTDGRVCRLSTGAGFAATDVARARVIMAMNDFIVVR